jgi:hypothetical protein
VIQNMDIEDSQGNIIIDQRQVLKIFENYITELYNRPNQPENLEVEPEEEVHADKKVLQRVKEERNILQPRKRRKAN